MLTVGPENGKSATPGAVHLDEGVEFIMRMAKPAISGGQLVLMDSIGRFGIPGLRLSMSSRDSGMR
ncbi:hypothetical protein HDF12_004273 [Edaphobacter lichenicola]|uniref:Uncharacterized protein n=1 Tax=Tunturiibacter lichenicola TaxID=2051959 RepID=A0A7Y9NQV2_9BACT|nr:hypothetical protein [Edaphobacter lichenicola]